MFETDKIKTQEELILLEENLKIKNNERNQFLLSFYNNKDLVRRKDNWKKTKKLLKNNYLKANALLITVPIIGVSIFGTLSLPLIITIVKISLLITSSAVSLVILLNIIVEIIQKLLDPDLKFKLLTICSDEEYEKSKEYVKDGEPKVVKLNKEVELLNRDISVLKEKFYNYERFKNMSDNSQKQFIISNKKAAPDSEEERKKLELVDQILTALINGDCISNQDEYLKSIGENHLLRK